MSAQTVLAGVARKRAWIILFAGPPALILAMAILLSAPGPLQRSFCPSDALIASHLTGSGIVVGAGVAGLAPLIGAVLYLRAASTGARPLMIGAATILATIAGLAFWLIDLQNYYCATVTHIVVHQSLSPPRIYEWNDVKTVRTGCFPGAKGGVSVDLDLKMSDGLWLGLGGDSLPSLMKHYHQVGELTRGAAYDNALTDKCPPRWRELFASRPS